jgi:hypothetical protein
MSESTTEQQTTFRQGQYLDFIHWHFREYSRLPTLHEIRDGMEMKSHNGARCAVQRLKELGLLEEGPGGRGYRLPATQQRTHKVHLLPGQGIQLGNIFIGVYEMGPEVGAGIEIMAPDFLGEIERDGIDAT